MHGALSWSWSVSCGHRLPHYSGRGEARERLQPLLLQPAFPALFVCLSMVLVIEPRVSSALGTLASFSYRALASSLPLVSDFLLWKASEWW